MVGSVVFRYRLNAWSPPLTWWTGRLGGCLLVFLAGVGTLAQEGQPTAEQLQFFETKVRPLLSEHCYACHSGEAGKLQAGLFVDSRSGLLRGGDSGPAIVPGDPQASLLIQAVHYEAYEMPPKGKLSDAEIEMLERWVAMGAPWPPEEVARNQDGVPAFDWLQRKAEHWVWQPVSNPPLPEVKASHWPSDDLDHFILAKLEAEGLSPAADADRATLLRRLYFDLIGLPPTPQQVEDFLTDDSVDATQRLVDSLLASPHFGERWGRHWLDLVRYAESRGHEFDNDAAYAWQYRDYIIRAFNADIPYQQLVHEHLAGDLLSEPRRHPRSGANESILGTGFWFLGEWVHSPVDIRKDETDRFDNMLDVMSKTFLGMTVACARCHDHKFDAISSADYYALSGFLQSSDYREVPVDSLEHNRRIAAALAALEGHYRQRTDAILASHGLTPPKFEPLPEDLRGYVVVDYGSVPSAEYRQDGFIFGAGPRRVGDAWLAVEEKEPQVRFADATAAVSDLFWNGLEAIPEPAIQNRNALARLPRSGRTLRSPTFTLTSGELACRVRGDGHVVACIDSHRLVLGPLHAQTIQRIEPKTEWTILDLQRYVGHRLHLEFTPAKDRSLEVSLVLQGASPEVRQEISDWTERLAHQGEEFSRQAESLLQAHQPSLAVAWATERERLRSQLRHRSQLAMAMLDGTGEDDHLLIRGNAAKPGPLVPRRFLAAVAGEAPMDIETGSGRLELAQQMTAPDNPLVWRVIVNRLWHHLMGRGIVPTTDDFGVLGQPPTHPELLDHLASRFVQDGGSIKRMIRAMVLSRTYQLSSQPEPPAVAADPKNRWWHHRPPKRLEGEAIRDALLAISGRLDAKPFGPSVPVHLTPFMDGRGKPSQSGPLDGDGRRSIYLAIRRNFLSPFMLAFDTPVPFSTMGRRNVSNVPAQALILMNDPLVVDLAHAWARQTCSLSEDEAARIDRMYRAAFGRSPAVKEMTAIREYLSAEAERRGVTDDAHGLWSDLAHALVNTKEFIFLK